MNYQYSNQGYLRLPFNSCGVCIGYNKLLVFGGSVHDVKTTDCSVIII